MNINKVFSELKIDNEVWDAVSQGWEESIAAKPDHVPEFLCPERFKETREYCGLEPEVDCVLEETAKIIIDNPALLAFTWHFYYRHHGS